MVNVMFEMAWEQVFFKTVMGDENADAYLTASTRLFQSG